MGNRKSMKRKRIKRLKKAAESLTKQKEEHLWKAHHEKGRLDITPKYWLGEAERFEKMSEEKDDKAEELKRK